MKNQKDWMQNAMETAEKSIEEANVPSQMQKDRMLQNILTQAKYEEAVVEHEENRFLSIIVKYPWQVAFSAATAWTIILTSIFGSGYTNLFVGMFGA